MPGALVIGGDYRGLGIVRSLGRRGIPVWVLHHEHRLATYSRFAQRSLEWPGGDDEGQVQFLISLATNSELTGWLVYPTTDETARLLSVHKEQLEKHFVITTPGWDVLRYVYDKRLTYSLAQAAGIRTPRTYHPANRIALGSTKLEFPVLLKPATRSGHDRFTRDKAWRCDDQTALLSAYNEVAMMVDPAIIMMQELIPGGGASQFSYAALCADGEVLAGMTVRRTRQYPLDFGKFSTFVETVEAPQVTAAARTFLKALNYTGLVEVEFKLDPRDGAYKLLDVNGRVWGWHSLGAQIGVDFPYLMWLFCNSMPLPPIPNPEAGERWVYLFPDAVARAHEIVRMVQSIPHHLRTLSGPRAPAIYAKDDKAPFFMSGLAVFHRRFSMPISSGQQVGNVARPSRVEQETNHDPMTVFHEPIDKQAATMNIRTSLSKVKVT